MNKNQILLVFLFTIIISIIVIIIIFRKERFDYEKISGTNGGYCLPSTNEPSSNICPNNLTSCKGQSSYYINQNPQLLCDNDNNCKGYTLSGNTDSEGNGTFALKNTINGTSSDGGGWAECWAKVSYDCESGGCTKRYDGNGQYPSLKDCQDPQTGCDKKYCLKCETVTNPVNNAIITKLKIQFLVNYQN